jgi:hypothetical protein
VSSIIASDTPARLSIPPVPRPRKRNLAIPVAVGAMACILALGVFAISQSGGRLTSASKQSEPTVQQFPVTQERGANNKCDSTQFWTAQSLEAGNDARKVDFCREQKVDRENQFPDRRVKLLSTKVTRSDGITRYVCLFEDRMENDKCTDD